MKQNGSSKAAHKLLREAARRLAPAAWATERNEAKRRELQDRYGGMTRYVAETLVIMGSEPAADLAEALELDTENESDYERLVDLVAEVIQPEIERLEAKSE